MCPIGYESMENSPLVPVAPIVPEAHAGPCPFSVWVSRDWIATVRFFWYVANNPSCRSVAWKENHTTFKVKNKKKVGKDKIKPEE